MLLHGANLTGPVYKVTRHDEPARATGVDLTIRLLRVIQPIAGNDLLVLVRARIVIRGAVDGPSSQ
jgi:hypothetical protein